MKAILFDFDYTLVDSSPSVIHNFSLIFKRRQLDPPEDDVLKKCIGMSLEDILLKFFPELNDSELEALKQEYLSLSAEYSTPLTYFFPDTISALEHIKELDYKIAIVSTKFTKRITEFLHVHKQCGLFDLVIGGDKVKNYKPDPEGIHLVSHLLDIALKDLIFVGDSFYDFEAAKNAGIAFKAVLNGTTTFEEFVAYGCPPEDIFPSLTALAMSLYPH